MEFEGHNQAVSHNSSPLKNSSQSNGSLTTWHSPVARRQVDCPALQPWPAQVQVAHETSKTVGAADGEEVGAPVGAPVGVGVANSQSSSPARNVSHCDVWATSSQVPDAPRRQAPWVPAQPPRDWQVQDAQVTTKTVGLDVGEDVGVAVGLCVGEASTSSHTWSPAKNVSQADMPNALVFSHVPEAARRHAASLVSQPPSDSHVQVAHVAAEAVGVGVGACVGVAVGAKVGEPEANSQS